MSTISKLYDCYYVVDEPGEWAQHEFGAVHMYMLVHIWSLGWNDM